MQVPFLDLQALYREDAAAYDAAYHRVMDSGRWILGPELSRFEAAFASYCGRRHAVGVGNGLEALRLALVVSGIGPGDEVIVPAHTFIATWLAVQQCGATPVPVEPDDGSFNIGPEGVKAALSARTRAVIPVHLYGHAANGPALEALCAEHGLVLIEDAAQAQGARWDERRVGSFGQLSAFSFYPGKNLGAFGDAGAVLTDDDGLAHALRQQRNYGSTHRYAHESLGTNSRLDELQAAWLQVRLAKLDAHNARRSEVATQYAQHLTHLPGLHLPQTAPGSQPVWHLYVVQAEARDALQRWLAERGVETLVHYPRAVYGFEPFAAHRPTAQTRSDQICEQVLSLPMGPHLSDVQVMYVCEAVRNFFEAHRP